MEEGAVLTMGTTGRGTLAGWTVHDAHGQIGPRRQNSEPKRASRRAKASATPDDASAA